MKNPEHGPLYPWSIQPTTDRDLFGVYNFHKSSHPIHYVKRQDLKEERENLQKLADAYNGIKHEEI